MYKCTKCTMKIVAISPSKYQEIGCSLSFDSFAKSAMGLRTKERSCDVLYFKIAVTQRVTQSFANPPIITQNPSVQASPLLHSLARDAERPWEGHNLSIILLDFRHSALDFRCTKTKLFYAAPLKWTDAELQRANAL